MNELRIQDPKVRLPASESIKEPLKAAYHRFLDAWFKVEDHPAPSAQSLVDAVRRLTEIYTERRGENPFKNIRLLQARLYFFMPTDVPKAWLPVAELLARRPDLLERPVLRILDLGAGIGTGCLGALTVLAAHGWKGTVELTAVEPDSTLRAPLLRALDAAEEALGIPVEVTHRARDITTWLDQGGKGNSRDRGPGRFDLVLAVNVLTEALDPLRYAEEGEDMVARLRSHLARDGAIIFVEPALREPARRLSLLRDRLHDHGVPIFGPCLATGPCPETLTGEGYCFHSIKVPLNGYLQKLGDLAGLRRHEVNFHYLTLAPGDDGPMGHLPPDLPGPHVRTISYGAKNRMGFQFHCCHGDGLLRASLDRWSDTGGEDKVRTKRLPHGTIIATGA
ncbi:MAG: small ribosomal subunit Rsm22 family protein [Pseudomonadota bacterium]